MRCRELYLGNKTKSFNRETLEMLYTHFLRNSGEMVDFGTFLEKYKDKRVIKDVFSNDFTDYIRLLSHSNITEFDDYNSEQEEPYASYFVVKSSDSKIVINCSDYELVFDWWMIIDERSRFFKIRENDVDEVIRCCFYFKRSESKEQEEKILHLIKEGVLKYKHSTDYMINFASFKFFSNLDAENYCLIALDSKHGKEFISIKEKIVPYSVAKYLSK